MIEWIDTTEERYDEMMGVLPPAADAPNAFLVGEPVSHSGGRPTFDCYRVVDGKYQVSKEAITFQQFKAEFPEAEYYYDS